MKGVSILPVTYYAGFMSLVFTALQLQTKLCHGLPEEVCRQLEGFFAQHHDVEQYSPSLLGNKVMEYLVSVRNVPMIDSHRIASEVEKNMNDLKVWPQ